MRLKDKVCLITGAAGGLGLAYAKGFVREGAVVAVADINADGATEAAQSLGEGKASGHHVDIASLESAERLVDEVRAKYGRIDVLVNNAAFYRGIDLESTSDEYLDRVMQVNFSGVWRMSRAVTPVMIEQGAGKIINLGSDAAYAYWGHPMTTSELPNFSYGISKWGVHGLTKFMASALGPKGINVNCISPGVILTEATKEVMSAETISGMEKNLLPLGKVLKPEDVVGAALFFASSDSDLVTGQILCVDSGMFMPT